MPSYAVLICAACWPDVRVLPGGHVLRLVPPVRDGATDAPTTHRQAA